MDEAMSEPVRTPPFAPFEWLLSGRYLRARRKEGFISVIAGFSFLGIMLGVATLIIVMAVMNGFRKELLDKILGLNGHLLVQPLESPLTDWKDVAERINQVAGIRIAAPVVDGQALASSPFNAAGVLVRGIRSAAFALQNAEPPPSRPRMRIGWVGGSLRGVWAAARQSIPAADHNHNRSGARSWFNLKHNHPDCASCFEKNCGTAQNFR